MKKKSKIIALTICVAVLITSTIIVHGGERDITLKDGSKLYTKSETSSEKIVRVESTPKKTNFTITYNKSSKRLTISEYEPSWMPLIPEKLVKTKTYNLRSRADDVGTIISSGSEAWYDYAYRVRKLVPQNRWWLKTSSNSKTIYETSNNLTSLRGFRTGVNTMSQKQTQIYAICGGTLITTIASCATLCFATGVLAPVGAITGVLVAIGATVAAGYLFYDCLMAKRDADYYFGCV